eukprot:scaffold4251_cov56-Isochrysis_galbana.AAC.1
MAAEAAAAAQAAQAAAADAAAELERIKAEGEAERAELGREALAAKARADQVGCDYIGAVAGQYCVERGGAGHGLGWGDRVPQGWLGL